MKKILMTIISAFLIIGFVSCNAATTSVSKSVTVTPQATSSAAATASPTAQPAPTDTPRPVTTIPAFLRTASSSNISAIDSNNIWKIYEAASSLSFNSSNSPMYYHFIHWNGSNWQFVADPQDTAANITFTSISAVSSQDIWAVGSSGAEHWDGTQWNIAQTAPTPAGYTYSMETVLALSGNDVWAAGMEQNNAQPGPEGTFPLIEHWNGTQWNVNILQTGIYGSLTDLGASSSTDVWAVGNYTNSGGFIEHWNGQTWAKTQINAISTNMLQIVAIAPNNVWATGQEQIFSFAEHWNGAQWKIVTPIPQNPQNYQNYSLVETGSQNIWQMQNTSESAADPTILKQWTGNGFSALPQVSVPGKQPVISEMQFIDTNSFWVFGNPSASSSSGNQSLPWFAFWNGSSWTVYSVLQ